MHSNKISKNRVQTNAAISATTKNNTIKTKIDTKRSHAKLFENITHKKNINKKEHPGKVQIECETRKAREMPERWHRDTKKKL